jgi:hypothetical protein
MLLNRFGQEYFVVVTCSGPLTENSERSFQVATLLLHLRPFQPTLIHKWVLFAHTLIEIASLYSTPHHTVTFRSQHIAATLSQSPHNNHTSLTSSYKLFLLSVSARSMYTLHLILSGIFGNSACAYDTASLTDSVSFVLKILLKFL